MLRKSTGILIFLSIFFLNTRMHHVTERLQNDFSDSQILKNELLGIGTNKRSWLWNVKNENDNRSVFPLQDPCCSVLIQGDKICHYGQMREKPPNFVCRREGGVILRWGLPSVRLGAVACQPEPSCRQTVEWSTTLLFSNTKASGFRANQNPGLVSGLVCWPPVCFDKLAICQLCRYPWPVAWCWTFCMTYNMSGKNITMTIWLICTSRMTPVSVFFVLSPSVLESVLVTIFIWGKQKIMFHPSL